MMSSTKEALLFLISSLFDLYLLVLIVRIILVYVNAYYLDPLVQFITKLTNFIVLPIRRVVPNIGRFETASILLLIILDLIKFLIVLTITIAVPGILALLILVVADCLWLVITTFFYAIFIYAIFTWIQPSSPMTRTLAQFTSPVLQPFRRFIPPISGFDISPIAALLFLQLLLILFVNPLIKYGVSLVV